MLIYI
jgi:alpha-galactosidase